VLIRLDTPYADVRARDLSLAIGLEPVPALQTLELRVGTWEVELRLLGYSHQVLVRMPATTIWSETVAGRPDVPGSLPRRRTERGGFGAYAFESRVDLLDAEVASHALHAASADPRGLAGLFTGPEGAFTALGLDEQRAGVTWTTWHAYPQSEELVVTTSRLFR
jgi:hypothetical protein